MVGQAWPRHGVFLGVPRKYLCHDLLFPSHSISLLLCNLPLLCTFFFRQAEIHFKTHMQLGFNKYTILKNKHVKNKTNKKTHNPPNSHCFKVLVITALVIIIIRLKTTSLDHRMACFEVPSKPHPDPTHPVGTVAIH